MEDKKKHPLDHAEYIRLLVNNQSRITTYIQALVQNYQDAEDIFQETATIAWEKFDEYQPGSNFTAWAITIARYRVMHYWQKNKSNIIHCSNDTLNLIEQHIAVGDQQLSNDTSHLQHCLQKLTERDLELVQMRYSSKTTIKAMAQKLQRSIHGLYSTMTRIHLALAECIRRRRSMEGR